MNNSEAPKGTVLNPVEKICPLCELGHKITYKQIIQNADTREIMLLSAKRYGKSKSLRHVCNTDKGKESKQMIVDETTKITKEDISKMHDKLTEPDTGERGCVTQEHLIKALPVPEQPPKEIKSKADIKKEKAVAAWNTIAGVFGVDMAKAEIRLAASSSAVNLFTHIMQTTKKKKRVKKNKNRVDKAKKKAAKAARKRNRRK